MFDELENDLWSYIDYKADHADLVDDHDPSDITELYENAHAAALKYAEACGIEVNSLR